MATRCLRKHRLRLHPRVIRRRLNPANKGSGSSAVPVPNAFSSSLILDTGNCEMSRIFNFSAGPAILPEPVLRQVQEELLDWHGCGMSVMEMSHRDKDFMSIAA